MIEALCHQSYFLKLGLVSDVPKCCTIKLDNTDVTSKMITRGKPKDSEIKK
jgi:hypothetical protein